MIVFAFGFLAGAAFDIGNIGAAVSFAVMATVAHYVQYRWEP